MLLTDAFDIAFAVGVAVAAFALAGAAARFLSRSTLIGLASLELAAAVAAWLAFALRHSHPRELAVAAGGLTGCLLAACAAVALRQVLERSEQIEAHLANAQARLEALVDREAEERAAELERTLARARAESVSLLVDEERKLADDHRHEFAEREKTAAASLTKALTETQSQVEQRLAGWAQDLDRAADATKRRIAELSQRQTQLLAEVETRLAADSERLSAEGDELRTAVQRIRAEHDNALAEALVATRAELDAHAAERRRALHELDERMRRRERELLEQIEREEVEATQRIHAGFEDVQRRQIEQLERVVDAQRLRTPTKRRSSSPGSSSRAARTPPAASRASSTAPSRCSRARRSRCWPNGSRMSATPARSGSSGGWPMRRTRSSAGATSDSVHSTGESESSRPKFAGVWRSSGPTRRPNGP